MTKTNQELESNCFVIFSVTHLLPESVSIERRWVSSFKSGDGWVLDGFSIIEMALEAF